MRFYAIVIKVGIVPLYAGAKQLQKQAWQNRLVHKWQNKYLNNHYS